jgi:hypothetical protein
MTPFDPSGPLLITSPEPSVTLWLLRPGSSRSVASGRGCKLIVLVPCRRALRLARAASAPRLATSLTGRDRSLRGLRTRSCLRATRCSGASCRRRWRRALTADSTRTPRCWSCGCATRQHLQARRCTRVNAVAQRRRSHRVLDLWFWYGFMIASRSRRLPSWENESRQACLGTAPIEGKCGIAASMWFKAYARSACPPCAAGLLITALACSSRGSVYT